MGRQYIRHLNLQEATKPPKSSIEEDTSSNSGNAIYSCKYCGVDFCYQKDLISKSFHGKTGQAFLFNNCVNVFVGPQAEKEMMTGKHIVVDVYCI